TARGGEMPSDEGFARLDKKTGAKVLCCREDCGQVLARVVEREVGRVLEFEMGWARGADGVWARTRHAQQRIRYGRPMAHRRPPRGIIRRVEGDAIELYDNAPTPGAYPVEVRCPNCSRRQALDAARLRVVVDRRG